MNVPSLQFCAIPDHYSYIWPIICTLDSLNTVFKVGWSLQVLEILLEAVDFQNRKQVVPGPLVSISLYQGRLPQAVVDLYRSQEPQRPCSPERACLGSMVCGPPSSSPTRVRARVLVAEGGHQDAKYLAPVDGRCGTLIPLPPPPWVRFTPAEPRLRPGRLQAAPVGETPLRSTSLSPRRAWISHDAVRRCRKESILRSFAFWCC
jgi:hypothetical protein